MAAAGLIYRIPLLGRLLEETVKGGPKTKLLFIVNCLAIWVLAIILFGYPAIIIPALAAVPTMFILIIMLTWDDFL